MRSLFVLPIAVLLSCCASAGGTAAIHEKCGASPRQWSLLAAPPQGETRMLAAAGISNAGKNGKKLHWFESGAGEVMLCHVSSDNRTSNSLLGRDCFSTRWIFSERNGTWEPAGQASTAFCGNY
jgi:hypothetical protein